MTDDKLAKEAFNTAMSISQYIEDSPVLPLYRRQALLAARDANLVLYRELGSGIPTVKKVEKPA